MAKGCSCYSGGGKGPSYSGASSPYKGGAAYSGGGIQPYSQSSSQYRGSAMDYGKGGAATGAYKGRQNPLEMLSTSAYNQLASMMGKGGMKSCPNCGAPLLEEMAVCPICRR